MKIVRSPRRHRARAPRRYFPDFQSSDSDVISFPESANSALFADILKGKDTLRVYNVHLQSYQISSREFLYVNNGRNFLKRLNQGGLKAQAAGAARAGSY